MNNSELASDIALYHAAAELFGLQADSDERRKSVRQKCNAMIMVAPYVQGNQPTESFLPMHCNDVSGGGISFFSQKMDPARLVVVRLNTEKPTSLVARIIRQTPADDLNFAYLVSCQFMGRPD